MWLPHRFTPAAFPLRLAAPKMVLATQSSSIESPTTTKPVAPVISSELLSVDPQIATAPGFVAFIGPPMVELTTTTVAPPEATKDPVTVAPTTQVLPGPVALTPASLPVRVRSQPILVTTA